MPGRNGNQLGTYLRDRRAKLDPAALGFPVTRRRTPGLRREEVAQRAHVSATWYTWLEQGRGGSPIARAGASANLQELVDELRRLSPEFEMMWRENDVRTHGGGTKHFRHPVAGVLAVEYSAFSIDGRPDLSLVIYNPATPKDVNKIRGLLKS